MLSFTAFIGMSCSIKDAFPRDLPSGGIYNISTYCDAFDVLVKVRKFMFYAFFETSSLFDEHVCCPLWQQNMSGSPLNIFAVDERAEPS